MRLGTPRATGFVKDDLRAAATTEPCPPPDRAAGRPEAAPEPAPDQEPVAAG